MSHYLRVSLICFLAFFSILSRTPVHAVTSFERTVERDIALSKTLPLYLQHRLGNVTIQGWVQDRVRVTLKEKVFANSETEANLAFSKFDLTTLSTLKQFEIRVGHVQGSDLVTKMREIHQNSVQIDLEIKAPATSDFTILMGEGKNLKIDSWHGGLTISGSKNQVQLGKLTLTKPLSLRCLECSTELKDSKLGGHLILGSKGMFLSQVQGSPLLSIESTAEDIRIENSSGNISVNSKSGRLSVAKFEGDLSFQGVEGGVDITGLKGNLSAQTSSGQVIVDADLVKRAFTLDTERGDIQVSLPPNFEANLDLMSLRGEVVVQFPYEQKQARRDSEYGPASPGIVEGQVGQSDSIHLHAYTKQGGVRILRKVPGR